MNDTEIIKEISAFKNRLRRHSIMVIILSCVALFIGVAFFYTRSNSNSRIRELEKENKMLSLQMDSLNTQYSVDSLDRANVVIEQEKIRQEKTALAEDIRAFAAQLKQFKQQYAKISDYKDVPADSLLRIFQKRFDY